MSIFDEERLPLIPFQGSDLSTVPNGAIVLNLPEYATLPAASTMVGRMVRNTTDGRVYESRKVFGNLGFDFVDVGRPTWMPTLLPSNSWTMSMLVETQKSGAIAQYLMSLGDSDVGTTQQISLFFQQVQNKVYMRIGGNEVNADYTVPASLSFLNIVMSSNGIKTDLWINNVKIASLVANGAYVSTANLRICGYSDSAAYNAEANFVNFKVFNGYTSSPNLPSTLVDEIDFNNPVQWTGGMNGITKNGFPFVVTDGTPTGTYVDDWVPVDLTDPAQYELRNTGKLIGADAIVFEQPASADGFKSDFELEFLFKSDGLQGVEEYVLGSGLNPTRTWRLVQRTDGILQLKLRNGADGSVHRDLTVNKPFVVNAWEKVKISIRNEMVYFSYGGVETSYTTVGWEPEVSTRLRFYGQTPLGTRTYTSVSNFKLSRSGDMIINSPINDGSGTILTDISGKGNNGNLTDGSPASFWSTDNVPVEGTGNAIRYHSDDVKQKRKVFKNSGVDLVSIANFPALESIYTNNDGFTVIIDVSLSTLGVFGTMFAWGDAPISTNFSIKQRTNDVVWGGTSTGEYAVSTKVLKANQYYSIGTSRRPTDVCLSFDGDKYFRRSSSTLPHAGKGILIGGHSAGVENIEGSVARVRIYKGYTETFDGTGLELIDMLDFNDPNQWTGGLTGTTLKGNPFTITNAAPVEMYVDDLVPVNKLS